MSGQERLKRTVLQWWCCETGKLFYYQFQFVFCYRFQKLLIGVVVLHVVTSPVIDCLCCKGPEADQDDESELSMAELKMQRDRQKKEVEVLRQLEAKEMEEMVQRKLKADQDVGCTWGFGTSMNLCHYVYQRKRKQEQNDNVNTYLTAFYLGHRG